MSDKPVILLMGPTASGKTRLAMELYDRGGFELINVDSALVYRGMNIGSAKPSAEELTQYPHRLVDIRDPDQPYSVASFYDDAWQAIDEVLARGNTPLLVGGTILYFKALVDGLADMPSADPALRAEIEARANKEGWPALHEELAKVDPQAAARLHPNHSQRIQRALEVYYVSGKSLTQWHQEQGDHERAKGYNLKPIAIMADTRELLDQRIEGRFEAMLEQGLIDEVNRLRDQYDLNLDLPSMRSVGYRQVWQYLEQELTYDQMVEDANTATRRLARRQLTWLRKWPDLPWLYVGEEVNWSDLASQLMDQLDLV